MKLVLVRHGETLHNREGRVQGQNDVDLTSVGNLQAEAIGVALRTTGADALYSSPLRRTIQTAEPIARQLGLVVQPSSGLMELDTGDLDGLTSREMLEQYPKFMEDWRRGATWSKVPGGESLDNLQYRAWHAVEEISLSHSSSTVILVTHNFTIGMILCRALAIDNSLFRRFRHALASLTTIEHVRDNWVIVGLNDTCHLDAIVGEHQGKD